MPAPKVHLLLVSAQAAPNLLPALDPLLRPALAVLLVTQRMQAQADALQAVLTEAGVRCRQHPVPDEHKLALLEDALLAAAADQEGADVAFNLTGGTKLMALAAQSVADMQGWRMFYVDADTDQAIWLGAQRQQPPQPLTQHLRLSHYLRGYGYTPQGGVDRPQPEARHRELMDTLALQVGSLEQPLGQLNFLAQQAEDQRRLDIRMTPQQANDPKLAALLRNFAQARALQVQGDVIRFASEAERDLVKGGWLEQHVYRTLTGLHGELGLRDKAANLVVQSATGVKNEMDVAFMARNRLYVIECKTARMDAGLSPKANDTLFKLAEICRRVGGLGTRGMLVSYRPVRESEKQLAQALGIELVCAGQVARLKEHLTNWVRGPSGR
jgi:hypothetical protein